MYGAMIGDIVGSIYEFNNINTKDFPLFSYKCDFTDDTIMTVAVAKAILLSRNERYENGKKTFRMFLIEEMQKFGRNFPNPTGAYGGNFAIWLQQPDPQPYGSFGNGSAMRVSPCGLAAIDLEEALKLAEISASVSHDHPEGIKGAQAVAAAVFLAKTGKSKEEIKRHITENYYSIDFSLDSIRDSYRFDSSCQGSVPQALVAFFESNNFEDAIRNAISIGGDSDTIGAITGSVAWTYYAVQTGGIPGWVCGEIDPSMLAIKEKALTYLHEMCWKRASTYHRSGFCTPLLSVTERGSVNYNQESKEKWGETAAYKEHAEKTKNYTKDKWDTLNLEMNSIFAQFSAFMKSGAAPESPGTQDLVKTLQSHITENYYHCTDEILAGLGQMYVADERFRNYIDKNGDGTAEYVRKAIEVYCAK